MNYLSTFQNRRKLAILEQKAWAIPMVLIDFGSFSHLFLKHELFMKGAKSSILGVFEQKANAIAHGFDRFWVIFTRVGKI